MTKTTPKSFTPKRGDLYYINDSLLWQPIGKEMWSNRVGLIVSNDAFNRTSNCVQIVYTSTSPNKREHLTPTHIPLQSAGKEAVAICEQVYTVDISRLSHLVDTVKNDTMKIIDEAILFGLGINTGRNPQGLFRKWEQYIHTYPAIKEDVKQANHLSEEHYTIYKNLIDERNAYKNLADSLQEKLNLIHNLTVNKTGN